MADEMKSLQDNNNWDLVELPRDRNVIPGKWVYKIKLGPNGQIDKFKEHYVEKGFKQVEEFPTCKPETFGTLLQL